MGGASPAPGRGEARAAGARRSLFASLLWQTMLALVAGLLLVYALEGALRPLVDGHRLRLLVATTVSTGAVGGLLYWVIVRRIRRLNRALRAVAGGDLDQEVPPSGLADEIGELTASFNAMVGTLHDSFRRTQENDQLRRELIANVSHELRTPLTNMQGYLETLRDADPGSEDFSRHLDICHREARRLTHLVQDLFELSKMATDHLEFYMERMSLVELADQVAMAFEHRMEDKGIDYRVELADDPCEVVGDGNRLGQVITNLLGNALHFTPPGGTITLSVRRRGETAVLSVADTGIGIPERELPRIFDSFFRLEKSRSRNLGGTGLGLAICKAIVEKHEGEIRVESVVDEGTTFTITLAIAPDGD